MRWKMNERWKPQTHFLSVRFFAQSNLPRWFYVACIYNQFLLSSLYFTISVFLPAFIHKLIFCLIMIMLRNRYVSMSIIVRSWAHAHRPTSIVIVTASRPITNSRPTLFSFDCQIEKHLLLLFFGLCITLLLVMNCHHHHLADVYWTNAS